MAAAATILVRRPITQRVTATGALIAVFVFIPFWVPSAISVSDFSLAFLWPFVLAAWAITRPPKMPIGALLFGRTGAGLWIEGLCVGTALLFASLSMLISPEPSRALRIVLPMAYAVCALLFLSRFSPLSARRAIYAMICSGVIVTAIGIALAETGNGAVIAIYRLKGFFENANQLGLVIISFWPILLALFLQAQSSRTRYLCAGALLILAYALLLSAAKTSMVIAFVSTCLVCLYHAVRSRTLSRAFASIVIASAILVVCVPLIFWLLSWVSPIAFEKVNKIIVGGVQDYKTIRMRNLLWEESIRIGLAHPLIGGGAGVRVLGYTHAHNMILDYFRGTGVFGMAAAIGLLGAVATRTMGFVSSTWRSASADRTRETVVAASYLGALSYLVGNQLSDSFSPSTAFAFWMIYIAAYASAAQSAFHRHARVPVGHPRLAPRDRRLARA